MAKRKVFSAEQIIMKLREAEYHLNMTIATALPNPNLAFIKYWGIEKCFTRSGEWAVKMDWKPKGKHK
jgi:mevalonate pyrophosphate decarboxylase